MPFIYKKKFIVLINVLIFIAITLLIYLNIKETQRRKEAEGWVQHTYKVITNAEKLLRLSTQEVMASRGYVLTGNKTYLDPLYEARKELEIIILNLKSLTADNPYQQKRINNLEELIFIRKEISDSLNLLRDRHLDSAIAVTNSNIGKTFMDSIKNEIHAFSLEEYSLLRKRQENHLASRNREELVKAILIFSLVVLIGFFIWLLLRYIRTQQALYLEASQKSAILDQLTEAIVITDKNFSIIHWNKTCETMYGWSRQEVIGKSVGDVLKIRTTDKYSSTFEQLMKFGHWSGEFLHYHRDGHEIPVLASVTLLKDPNAVSTGAVAVFRNITERKKLETTLQKSNQSLEFLLEKQLKETKEANNKLRKFNKDLEQAREEERKRISRELHDDLGQRLTSAKLYLSYIGEELDIKDDQLKNSFNDVLKTLDNSIASVRSIAMELRPMALEDLGFLQVITTHVKKFEKEIGIPVNLDIRINELKISNETGMHAFRVFQESLNNIAKHSEATRVSIIICREDSKLMMLIRDNGKGFDTSELNFNSLGLKTMKERSALINADYTLHSFPGKGTEVKILLPL